MRKSTLISFGLVGFLATALLAFAQDAGPQPSQINIDVRDYCDPTSFNAALGSVGAWRFVPNQMRAHEGATLNLQNLGGETHTSTRVKRFGGGFVSVLNFLPPAPECAQMVNGSLVPQPPSPDNLFIPAGTTAGATLHPGEVARFQCCIHPWMRVTVTPKDEQHTELH